DAGRRESQTNLSDDPGDGGPLVEGGNDDAYLPPAALGNSDLARTAFRRSPFCERIRRTRWDSRQSGHPGPGRAPSHGILDPSASLSGRHVTPIGQSASTMTRSGDQPATLPIDGRG